MPPGEKYFWLAGMRRLAAQRRLDFISDMGVVFNGKTDDSKEWLANLAKAAYYGENDEKFKLLMAAIYSGR